MALVKRLFLIILLLNMVGYPLQVTAQEQEDEPTESALSPIDIEAEAAFAVDFDSQQVLLDQNADEVRPIASLTKMISAYLIYEAVAAGELSFDEPVVASARASEVSQGLNLSNVPLVEGETYRLGELMEALAIYSANSATIALAEHYAGSEEDFVGLMRDLLDSWGIEDYQIINSSGLNNDLLNPDFWYPGTDSDDENMMSTRDIAKVSQHLVTDFPEYLEISSIDEKYFRPNQEEETLMVNYNWLVPGLEYEYPGVTGLKTGTTAGSGASISITADKDGRRILGLVMGAGDGIVNKSQRFEESHRLLDYAFDHFENASVQLENFPDQTMVDIVDGQEEDLSLTSDEEVLVTLVEGQDLSSLETEMVFKEGFLDDEGQLTAPIEKGQELGYLVITNPSIGLGQLPNQEGQRLPLYAGETISAASPVQKLWRSIRDAGQAAWNKLREFQIGAVISS